MTETRIVKLTKIREQTLYVEIELSEEQIALVAQAVAMGYGNPIADLAWDLTDVEGDFQHWETANALFRMNEHVDSIPPNFTKYVPSREEVSKCIETIKWGA